MPIAIYLVMNEFTNHNFNVEKGDCLYLFSDGFSDQYGGSNKRKFMSGNFKKLLQNISSKSMKEQKKILSETIDSWMNYSGKTYEQTDDITVLGIKI
ncbi:MAG: SpoIIE family protein phosphatase [Bacteroidetes bacterium]|nr:SpoIIE family protein phosphatase [Bacteroidota bacterium]